MRKKFAVLTLSVLLVSQFLAPVHASAAEWTFLIFLNGNNNLDSYGTDDLNEMEQVGSTDKINVVVQWASLEAKKVRRLLIKKDNDPVNVTSPVVEDLGSVDMGDWHSLTDFVNWGVKNYPAQKYFVDVWDHGSGWHERFANGLKPTDISWDEITGNFMTTKQLGLAMTEASRIIGHKVDIYGSDACLMTMLEVAGEMSESVNVFVGSEEVEPAEGWPYDALLRKWNALGNATPRAVAKVLTEEYVKSYQGGSQGTREITFSALDLSKYNAVATAVTALGQNLKTFGDDERQKATAAAEATEYFTYRDYGDLLDFLSNLKASSISRLDNRVVKAVEDSVEQLVFVNLGSSGYAKAKGVAIWLPTSTWTHDPYAELYKDLEFQKQTDWGSALAYLLK
jgi:hypothetical protein